MKPDEATLVPERRQELTTEGGLDVVAHQAAVARALAKLHQASIPVVPFIDPDSRQIEAAKLLGASAVEIQTARFSKARTPAERDRELGSPKPPTLPANMGCTFTWGTVSRMRTFTMPSHYPA